MSKLSCQENRLGTIKNGHSFQYRSDLLSSPDIERTLKYHRVDGENEWSSDSLLGQGIALPYCWLLSFAPMHLNPAGFCFTPLYFKSTSMAKWSRTTLGQKWPTMESKVINLDHHLLLLLLPYRCPGVLTVERALDWSVLGRVCVDLVSRHRGSVKHPVRVDILQQRGTF